MSFRVPLTRAISRLRPAPRTDDIDLEPKTGKIIGLF
jgi:hypothetical protein